VNLGSLTRRLPSLPSGWLGSERRHRRFWVHEGRAHIEVRTVSRPGSEPVAERVREACTRLEGVHWAEVNGVVGRVVVAFDPETADVGAILDAVAEVEDAEGVADEPFESARAEHPGDRDSLRAAGFALAADVAAMGLAFTGSVLRETPIPAEVSAVFGFA
jgi:cation-transporting ATPase I